jgi:hypothetical protein
VNVCSSLKAERNPGREALKFARATFNATGQSAPDSPLTVVPSTADMKKSSLEPFIHEPVMSAFV